MVAKRSGTPRRTQPNAPPCIPRPTPSPAPLSPLPAWVNPPPARPPVAAGPAVLLTCCAACTAAQLFGADQTKNPYTGDVGKEAVDYQGVCRGGAGVRGCGDRVWGQGVGGVGAKDGAPGGAGEHRLCCGHRGGGGRWGPWQQAAGVVDYPPLVGGCPPAPVFDLRGTICSGAWLRAPGLLSTGAGCGGGRGGVGRGQGSGACEGRGWGVCLAGVRWQEGTNQRRH